MYAQLRNTVFFQVFNDITNGNEGVKIFVCNLNVELIFTKKNKISQFERINAQITGKFCVFGNFICINVELFDEQIFDSFKHESLLHFKHNAFFVDVSEKNVSSFGHIPLYYNLYLLICQPFLVKSALKHSIIPQKTKKYPFLNPKIEDLLIDFPKKECFTHFSLLFEMNLL